MSNNDNGTQAQINAEIRKDLHKIIRRTEAAYFKARRNHKKTRHITKSLHKEYALLQMVSSRANFCAKVAMPGRTLHKLWVEAYHDVREVKAQRRAMMKVAA